MPILTTLGSNIRCYELCLDGVFNTIYVTKDISVNRGQISSLFCTKNAPFSSLFCQKGTPLFRSFLPKNGHYYGLKSVVFSQSDLNSVFLFVKIATDLYFFDMCRLGGDI